MRKTLILISMIVFILSLTACGNSGKTTQKEIEQQSNTTSSSVKAEISTTVSESDVKENLKNEDIQELIVAEIQRQITQKTDLDKDDMNIKINDTEINKADDGFNVTFWGEASGYYHNDKLRYEFSAEINISEDNTGVFPNCKDLLQYTLPKIIQLDKK